MKSCPLCNSTDIQEEEIVTSKDICKIHKKGLGVDPTYLFVNTPSLTFCQCKNCKIGFYFPFVCGDSRYYSLLGNINWYYEHEGKEEFSYAAKYVQKGQKVLDVGSGIGRFSRYLPEVEYLGIELSDFAISKAQENGVNVQKIDLFKLAKENPGYYDVVASFQVIEHISNPKEFIKSMKELLKPGGLLILATPNNDSKLFMTENSSLNAPPHHLLLWNRSSLEWISKELGMETSDIHTERVQDVHMEWFHRAMVKIALSRFFKFSLKKFETNFPIRVRNKFITLFGKLSSVLNLFTTKAEGEPGLSILAVLKK